jgi:hypothetical protein
VIDERSGRFQLDGVRGQFQMAPELLKNFGVVSEQYESADVW